MLLSFTGIYPDLWMLYDGYVDFITLLQSKNFNSKVDNLNTNNPPPPQERKIKPINFFLSRISDLCFYSNNRTPLQIRNHDIIDLEFRVILV